MKPAKFFLLLILFLPLLSCHPPLTYNTEKDDRPSEQLALIRRLAKSDSLYQAQYNPIKEAEVRDNEINGLINFIDDTLKHSFNKWPVTIHELRVSSFSSDYVDVTFLIPLQTALKEENPEFSSIVIRSNVSFEQTAVKDSLAKAYVGEKVWISGEFSKDESGNLTINGYAGDKNPFQNPEFGVTLSKVTF